MEENEDRGKITKIWCQNVNGFPSSKNNRHKLKVMNKIAEKVDIAVLLETGINKECRVEEIHDELRVTKVNKMPEVDRS